MNHVGVVVELVLVPYVVAVVHGQAPPVAEIVTGEEPRTVNSVQEAAPVQVTEVVATPYTPAPPFETRRFDDEGCDVVARPVYVMVELEPPTRAPRVERPLNGPEKVSEEVATFANVLTPLKYGILPVTAAVEVESPLKPTVAPERVIGQVVEMVACLLLKVDQSVEERSPRTDADADGKLKVKVPLELVMPQSFAIAVVEVASVIAPV